MVNLVKYTPKLLRDALANTAKGYLLDVYISGLRAGCNVYSKYLVRLPLLPIPRMYANGVCSLFNKPILPPPPPPFTGGQCQAVYGVSGVRAKNGVNYCETPNLNINWGFSVPGPIHGIRAKYVRTDDRYSCPDYKQIVGKADVYLAYVSYGSNPNDDRYSIIHFYEPHTKDEVVRITSVVRADGLADNCGNLPQEYPPDPEIDARDFSTKVTINNYDGDDNITESKEFNLNIPINNIKPEFNFDFNLGGVDFNIDLGGLNFGGDKSSDNNGGGGGGGSNEPPFNEEDFETDPEEEEKPPAEEEEVKKADIAWVLLEIVQFPVAGKTMLMADPTDNTYFAGYFSWLIETKTGDYRLEEIPIRKKKMAFKRPSDVQGYRFYTVNGARIKSTIYYQPQTQPAD